MGFVSVGRTKLPHLSPNRVVGGAANLAKWLANGVLRPRWTLGGEEGARPADRPASDPAGSRGAACNLGCYQARLTLSGVALRRAIIAARALPRAHGRAGISDLEVSTTDLINRLCFFISALLSACCGAMWALHHFMCKVVCAMPLFSSFNAAPVGRKGCFLNFGVTRCATIHVRLPTTEGRALWLRKSRVFAPDGRQSRRFGLIVHKCGRNQAHIKA